VFEVFACVFFSADFFEQFSCAQMKQELIKSFLKRIKKQKIDLFENHFFVQALLYPFYLFYNHFWLYTLRFPS